MQAIALPFAFMLAAASADGLSIEQIERDTAAAAFTIDPSYRPHMGADHASLSVINVFAITLPTGVRLVQAKSPGYLPVELKLDDGRCYTVTAHYRGGSFQGSQIEPGACATSPRQEIGPTPVAPRPGLRLVDRSWGFAAWEDAHAGMTIVTNAWDSGPPIVLSTPMKLIGMNAMRSPDAPSADITFIGTLQGRLEMITVELTF